MIRPTPKTKREFKQIGSGGLWPGGLLTKEDCLPVAGLGPNSMSDARRSGMVKPIHCGRRVYYRTEELIAWIESHAK